ncbi:MAG: hypothetical protein HQK92_15425 [Nitrospirae bacterium]|nr:hypothetical protein [Nitrospirota bacterium]
MSILKAQRDIAIHYYQEVSEDILYLQAQASITLFDDLLNKVVKARLADCIPERVLPVSSRPLKDLNVLIDSELSQIDGLLQERSRKGTQAASRLRPILAMATAIRNDSERVSEVELRKAINRRRHGDDWSIIFPEVAQLKLDTQGDGIPFFIRIKKTADFAVCVAKDGEPIIGTVIKQEVNIWDKYNLSRNDLAKKLEITAPKTGALIDELKIQDDKDCFKLLQRKSTIFKSYSKKALDLLKAAIDDGIDVDTVWRNYKYRKRK